MAMAEKAKQFSEQTGIIFSVKYEPAVISYGTFQRYLFEQNKFSPPNYFSLAELIAISHFYGLLNIIKFGQRDDIDDFQSVAAVPNLKDKHMFSPFDFLVYNAVQRFNADQDIWKFCADMSIAIEHASEFSKWEKDVYGGSRRSFLSKIFAEYKKQKFGDKYRGRIEFQKRVWRTLDKISYNNYKLSAEIQKNGKKGASNLKSRLKSLFLRNGIRVLQIKNVKFFDVGKYHNAPKLKNSHPDFTGATEEAVYQYEIVIENEGGLPQSLWEKIPLKPLNVSLKEFDFIYGDRE